MFEGTLTREAGGPRLKDRSGLVFNVADAGDASPGETAWLAVRPEKVRISREKPKVQNAIDGEVWDIAYFGDMTVYYVRLDDGRIVKASTINSLRRLEDTLTWHDRAWISFSADAGVVLTR